MVQNIERNACGETPVPLFRLEVGIEMSTKEIEDMKTKKFFLQHAAVLRYMVSAATILVFASCSRDDIDTVPVAGRSLRFEVSAAGDWNAFSATRCESDGCGDELLTLRGDSDADTLFIHSSVVDGIACGATDSNTSTRGAVATEMYDTFGVLGYLYAGSWSGVSCMPDFMYDVAVRHTSDVWTPDGTYFWPGDSRKLRFFAYAPYRGSGIVLSGKSVAGAPTFTYTVPANVADQKDILTASSDEFEGNRESAAPLAFSHALTAVRFTVGDDMMAGRITKVTLKNVYGKAVYDMGTAQWSGFVSSSSFTQTLSKEVDGTPDEDITPEEATFMMIPQTLPSGATIEVAYTDKLTNTARTLTASIAGTTWPVGRTVTYRISTTSISIASTFTVTAPDEFTYTGGTKAYKVDSRGVVTRPGDPQMSVPLAWTAEFVEDDGAGGYRVIEQPEWITGFTMSGNGGTSAQSFNATVTAQGVEESNPHNEALQKAQSINSTSGHTPYNLSNSAGAAGVQNTANCYVINAPGQYSLPLVYGNAIKDGSTNASAYTSSASGANVLKNFVNHTGNAITDPYIYNNANCTPDNATLIWQDSPELVTNVALSSDKHSITFDVNQETIAQGNAIVAVRDASNTILWSWHIWVTDYKLGDDLKTVAYSGTHIMLPVNLGWCDGTSASYAGRSVKVRFRQAETNAPQVIEITQTPYSVSTGGNAPFYQWGRKDPMLPSTGSGATNKTWYDAKGASSTALATASWTANSTVIKTGILNPRTFCTNFYMDKTYYNLWAVNNKATSENLATSAKTVYDPCPTGYKVPVNNAFRAFTTTGSNTSTASQINGTWNATSGGWDFKCNEGTVFFPASGYRSSSSGALYDVGSRGYYWSAVPSSTSNGRDLSFDSTYVSPLNRSSIRSNGFAVRPVRE